METASKERERVGPQPNCLNRGAEREQEGGGDKEE